MDFKYIEQLLERYWQCDTSLEEEAQLRAFFSRSDVPAHLLRYKEAGLDEDFDARVLAEVEPPVVKAKRLTLTARLVPMFKAAAAVALVLSLVNVMQHSFYSEVKEVAAADTIGKQITAPSVALSSDMTVTHEPQVLADTLPRIDKKGELEQ